MKDCDFMERFMGQLWEEDQGLPGWELLEMLPCGICYTVQDDVFTILKANDFYYGIFGYTEQEAIARGFTNSRFIIYPNDYEQVRRTIEQNIRTGQQTFELEYRIFHRSGELRWILERCRVYTKEPPHELAYVVFDITSRKQMEEDLRISEEQNRIAFKATDSHLDIFDIKNRTLTLMEDAAIELGQPQVVSNAPDSIVQSGIIAEESIDDYMAFFYAMVQGKPSGSCTVSLKNTLDGQFHWYTAKYTLIYDEDGEPSKGIMSRKDITRQRESELAYQKWSQYFELQRPNSIGYYEYNLTKDSFVGDDEDLPQNLPEYIRTFSGAVRYFADHMVYGEDLDKYFHFYNRETLMAKYYSGQKTLRFEYRRKKDGGGFFWVRGTAQLIPDPYTEDVKAFILVQDIDEEKQSFLLMREQIECDPLTGILNRRTIIEKVISIIRESAEGARHAFLMLDIDYFKNLNDDYGHLFGDVVLKETAAALRGVIHEGDLCGRIGGDEFIAFLKDIPSFGVMERRLKQLCAALCKDYGQERNVTISLGAVYPCGDETFEELYQKADIALYEAKGRGRNQFVIYYKDIWENTKLQVNRPMSAMALSLKHPMGGGKHIPVINYKDPQEIRCADSRLLLDCFVLECEEKREVLSKNEFLLLRFFFEHYGQIIEKDVLMKELWESEKFVEGNTLAVNILRIRKRLESIGSSLQIQSIRGVGYCIV